MSDNNVYESMELAAYIREINGDNRMGAAMLAEKILEWQAARAQSGQGVEPVGVMGFSAFELKAVAMEIHRAAAEMSDGDDDYPLDLVVCESVTEDDGSILGGPVLCVRDSDYPEEGVYPIPNSQRVRDKYTHPQPAQQGVPDGVWEALQRLIENGGQMGPASREDALLVARHRHYLMTTPQPEGDGWIKCSEQPPDEVFAEMETLVGLLRNAALNEEKVDTCFDESSKNPCLAVALRWLAEWLPTGLKRPQPPQEGE